MQVSTATSSMLTQGAVQEAVIPTPIAAGPLSGAAGVAPDPVDTVEISDEAAAASAGKVNPRGKATGHARAAENIEKNVAKLIERETARVERAGGDASALDGFREKVEGIAAAYAADPSGSPARVLSEIHAAVKVLRGGAVPAVGETPVDGEVPVDAPVGGETPVGSEEPLDEAPVVEDALVPGGGAPVDGPVGDQPIVADLSGLRMV